ncbi:metallopeptidase TldD-related protein [Athalassotoga saccharophila]|uniref:metallopeptidase TldD-related protein n=1 Tax=Athalassotoga saccharophila TaxID=1441386 RepID=UPI00137A71BA|nr:metallopeptidase TldD-related protein [Athalassotoga saccharophila]BBJ27726.1 metalloprotease TldE [Athalassotoga saccharophila]
MMIDSIAELLSAKVDDWKILERMVDGRELFFIKDSLDMNRAKRTHKFFVTIYSDFEKEGKLYRGSSDFTIYPGMKKDEIKSLIEENIFSSKFVENPYYPVVNEKHTVSKIDPSEPDLDRMIQDFPFKSEGVWINSSEFFLNRIEERIINSKGIDVSNKMYRLYVEMITTAKSKEEVELYWSFERSYPLVKMEIEEAMMATRDRAEAIPTPDVKDLPVILSGESVGEFFKYPLYKTSGLYIYEHLSDLKKGDRINGNFTMWIDPHVEGSAYSLNYDEDGFLCRKVKIIENSTVVNIWADVRYAYYLGIEPTGHLTNFVVECGNESEKSFEDGKYLKVLSFSDFQMDPVTGDFGGEIRLGWYGDGKKRVAVTGGSISGNITKCDFVLSSEYQLTGNFKGPKSLKITGAQVGGKRSTPHHL